MILHGIGKAWQRSRIAVLTVVGGFVPAICAGDGTSLTAEVTAATDYVSRGVSQTMSGAALQASVGIANDNGFSAYVWASNIDYVADGDPDDGARIEIDAVVQYDWMLTERLAATIGRGQYFNPGINPGLHYDYGEWWGQITVDNRHRLAVYQSDSIFGTGEAAWYVVAGTTFELSSGLTLDVEAGRFDLRRAWGQAFNHLALTLAGTVDAFTWQVAFHTTDDAARKMFYESVVEPRVVLGVTYTVW